MTKLFSVKSLAFAGAAAFALTLAAAPQADAAETTPGIAFQQYEKLTYEGDKISEEEYGKLDSKAQADYVRYKDGYRKVKRELVDNISAEDASIIVSRSAVNIVDGKLEYYYASAKPDKDVKKWVAISTTDYREREGNLYFTVPVSEITKRKAADVYIAADAEGAVKTTKIACKAAPKIKASLTKVTSGSSIEITEKSAKKTDGYVELSSQYMGFYAESDVEDLATGDESLIETLQNAADFGGTTFVVTYTSEDSMIPYATTKLKVPATPKAPKVGLKIAKAFSLKLKDTNQYRTFVKGLEEEEVEKVKWNTGSGALTMEGLLGKENLRSTAASTTDFVLNDTMQLQVKTIDKKGKKMDSRIATTTIYKSAATPSAVNAVISNDVKTVKKAPATNASIKFSTEGLTLSQADAVSSGAVVTLQYFEKGGKNWKDIKNLDKAITYKSGKIPDEIYVRVKGTDYKAANAKKNTKASYYEAPGQVMTIKLNKDDPANLSTYTTTDAAISLTKAQIDAAAKK